MELPEIKKLIGLNISQFIAEHPDEEEAAIILGYKLGLEELIRDIEQKEEASVNDNLTPQQKALMNAQCAECGD